MASSDVKRQFGTAIKTWRNRRGISQEELAGRAGLHRTYVSDIERGARNVSLESVEKLAHALELSVAALFAPLPHAAEAGPVRPARTLLPDELVDILLVEDNADDVALTLHALKQANIANRIQVARDGVEALDFLFCRGAHARRHAGDRPQVILLDLGLPRLNGMKVLQQIKADPRTRTIPVVVLTASRQDRDIAASKRLGADGYIVKPVDFHNLSEITPRLSLHWALLKPAGSAAS